jgi:hypothetical protein
MKKLIPLIVLVLVGGGIWFAMKRPGQTGPDGSSSQAPKVIPPSEVSGQQAGSTEDDLLDDEDGHEHDMGDLRPAAEIYKNAEDALAAVKGGAIEYDDLVLTQFTMPGEDCTWCEQFYRSVKDMLAAPDLKAEQRSYYSEILAISGKVDNIALLVDAIKNAKKPEEAETIAEALELAQGKEDVVNFLAQHMKSDSQILRDASISAITNQGSRQAAELLYKEAVESGSADGHYEQGIGLGELVPSDDALPFLQEAMQKRDGFSHLAVKSLLNNGIGGLRIVMDVLTNSKNPEADRQMLKNAIDHVNYEEEIEVYAKKLVETSKQPLVLEFAKQILDDLAIQTEESDEVFEEEEEPAPGEGPMSKLP